jgi:CDP-diacylglycerol--glycerol-3-phosphate 3-phosphatidyltransferase
MGCLDRAARGLVRLGVTANSVTVFSVAAAALAGVLLGFGRFGWAAAAMVIASLGDALDGLVARRSGSASVGGALLDASVDRYGEFFFLGGLAVYFRGWLLALVLALFALAGSYMVSYGSAKAEALHLPVPPGAMRRAGRAVCLCTGVALVPPSMWLARVGALPAWAALAPVLVALAVLAVAANVSAIRRLRALARVQPSVVAMRPGPEGRHRGIRSPRRSVARRSPGAGAQSPRARSANRAVRRDCRACARSR